MDANNLTYGCKNCTEEMKYEELEVNVVRGDKPYIECVCPYCGGNDFNMYKYMPNENKIYEVVH
jgi:RNase P subunit RPR2